MKQLLYLSLKSPCPYTTSSKIQESWVHRFLLNKQYPDTYIKPPALLLVAQFYPTYTCGRRENNSICPSDIKYLETNPTAIFIKTLRGGQITFHGPGQIVGYPILDLKDFKITPKEYVNRLESSIISTCKVFGIAAMRTEHTGFTSVWTSPIRKIASIGIHLRRHITSHGIALNVSTDLSYFKKIIACGLKGKEMTSFEREGVYVPLEIVESCWIKNLANQLGCTINRINPEQIGDILLNQ
ncbi:lipoyl(octanoyl) transferase [Pneumocystis murina B123]|uniref:Octanoyltransferase n=1 Tax=Pneumocystis murina (strain B123) TaxID=1069680 RepID=M7NUV0_PNEMU|nr:lipoyl(octanoyl) transferase [Pneumocystis murina B123]EMR11082.1 lipoyl(octanoyl) transferase [Pneumocystis murina B123]